MKYVLPNVETNRLRFRLLQPDDFQEWLSLFNSPDVARFLGLDPKLGVEILGQKWFDKVFHRYENDLGGMNVLIDKENNAFVGQCGLLVQEIEKETFMEVGYSILPKFWGMGYASEASQKCRDIAFSEGYCDKLISMVHVDNIGSETVAKKNGMQLMKTVDQETKNPMNIFAINRVEWESLKVGE